MADIRRPRYRKHRRLSRRQAAFNASMSTKFSGQETPIAANTVGSDVLALASTPTFFGPFTLRGAPPPELRSGPYWMSVAADNATVYQSRADLQAQRSPTTIAAWDLSPDIKSLDDGVAPVVATTEAGTTVATLGTGVAITTVANATETFTTVGHGYAVDDGPFQMTASGALPAGIVAATDYWIHSIPTGDTFLLTATKGGSIQAITTDGSGSIELVPVNVDRAENYLKKTAHGLATGQLARLTTDGALPTGLSTATNYWAIAVSADLLAFGSSLANAQAGTRIDITAIGSGTTTVLKCNIDTTTERFTKAAHGLVTGDAVQASTDGALPTGVSASTTYYVVTDSASTFRLSDTEAHALAGTDIIDVTAIGSGNQTFTLCRVDLTAESLRLDAHGMQTGDGPVRVSTTGALPTGLSAATDYWVIRVDANRFALATSLVNALALTKINITAVGSGTHQLVRALSIGVDLSASGILEWLAQGVRPETMRATAAASADAIFV